MPIKMPIKFVKWITRDMVRAEPEARFVFGDNTRRVGYGGQAKAMRDEPNAIGVATKWAPGNSSEDFFSDEEWADFGPSPLLIINVDIDKVEAALAAGRTVYVPFDGLGTGLSELPTRAPGLHAHIINRFRTFVADGEAFPWRE